MKLNIFLLEDHIDTRNLIESNLNELGTRIRSQVDKGKYSHSKFIPFADIECEAIPGSKSQQKGYQHYCKSDMENIFRKFDEKYNAHKSDINESVIILADILLTTRGGKDKYLADLIAFFHSKKDKVDYCKYIYLTSILIGTDKLRDHIQLECEDSEEIYKHLASYPSKRILMREKIDIQEIGESFFQKVYADVSNN
jgi:hypothetical protein